MKNRFQVRDSYSLPIFATGRASYLITDSVTNKTMCSHDFLMPTPGGPLNTAEWFAVQKLIAQCIAAALNESPPECIERIIEAQDLATAMVEALK